MHYLLEGKPGSDRSRGAPVSCRPVAVSLDKASGAIHDRARHSCSGQLLAGCLASGGLVARMEGDV